MIDLVYPLKKGGSKIDNAELRYSLRSVAANLRLAVRDVWIIGDLPPWLHGVKHVPMEDRMDKALNLREKYRKMCGLESLSDPFVLLDDDHIFLQPWDELPLHSMGSLKTLVRKYAGTSHGRYLELAMRTLEAQRLPTVNYQIHFPMLVHKAVLRGAVGMMTRPMVMGSIYANLIDGPRVEVEHDFRVNTDAEFAAKRDGPFVSFPPVLKASWVAFLEERFPTASSWEAPTFEVAKQELAAAVA